MKLYPANYLLGRSLLALDGEIGRCIDLLFDDRYYGIRYLVVDTRKWLPGRKVVISPSDIAQDGFVTCDGNLCVGLSKEEIRQSPPVEEHATVSSQIEAQLARYYGWPDYWTGAESWGISTAMPIVGAPLAQRRSSKALSKDFTPSSSLHSIRDVINYDINATDGSLGHVEDFLFDLQAWLIRFAALDTKNWLPGRTVALPTEWISQIDAFSQSVQVDRSRETLKASPSITVDEPIEASALQALHT